MSGVCRVMAAWAAAGAVENGRMLMYRYIIKNKGTYVFYVIFLVLSSVFSVMFSFVLGGIMDSAVQGSVSILLRYTIGGIIFLVITVGSEYMYGIAKNRLVKLARMGVKEDMLAGLMKRDTLTFEGEKTSVYISSFLQNLDMLESLYFNNVLDTPMVICSFLIAIAACLYIEPIMLLLIIVFSLFTTMVVKLMMSRLQKSTKEFSEALAGYTGEIDDILGGHRVVKLYAIGERLRERHHAGNVLVEGKKEKNLNDRVSFGCSNELVGLITTIAIMSIASFFAIKGDFSIGFVLAFGQLSGKIISPIMSASDIWMGFKSSKQIRKKYEELLFDKSSETSDADVQYGDIALESMSLRLGGKTIIDNFSYTFKKNHKYLVMGENGCGKSTLLSVIAGLYKSYEGKVIYAGTEIKNVAETSLSKVVTLVGQEPYLFNDTLRNNISFYGDYSDDEILAVMRKCKLEKMLEALPEGLDTMVSGNGVNFSGGEKQKINLARALLHDRKIFLLDEISSNLDSESTEQIENIILDIKDKLVISVAHKLSDEMIGRYDDVVTLKKVI